MKIYYDESHVCALSPNSSITPYVLVPDTFNLTKTEPVKVGEVQERDEEGQLLFIKEIFKTETKEVITGYTEVTKSSIDGKELEPVMVDVQKTDDEGNLLYYKVDEEGKKVETTEVTLSPVYIKMQKTNSVGMPLYNKPNIEIVEEQIKTGEEKVTEDTGIPSMKDVIEDKTFNLLDEPNKFTVQEVLIKKVEDLKPVYGDNIFYTEFINQDKVESFEGNSGLGCMQLAPKSKLTFKPIALSVDCNNIELVSFEGDSRATLSICNRHIKSKVTKLANTVKQMSITISNDTEDFLEIHKLFVVATFAEQTEQERNDARLTTLEESMTQMQSVIDEILLGGM